MEPLSGLPFSSQAQTVAFRLISRAESRSSRLSSRTCPADFVTLVAADLHDAAVIAATGGRCPRCQDGAAVASAEFWPLRGAGASRATIRSRAVRASYRRGSHRLRTVAGGACCCVTNTIAMNSVRTYAASVAHSTGHLIYRRIARAQLILFAFPCTGADVTTHRSCWSAAKVPRVRFRGGNLR